MSRRGPWARWRRGLSVAVAAALLATNPVLSASASAQDAAHPFQRQLEHAELDLAAGRVADAKARLHWLAERDPNRSNVAQYHANIARLTNAKPLSFSLRGGALQSTNVTRLTSQTTFSTPLGDFTIGTPETQRSGGGITAGATLAYSHAPTATRMWRLGLDVDGNYYKIKSLQRFSYGARLEHFWYRPGGSTSVALNARQIDYRDIAGETSADHRDLGVRLTHDTRLSARDRLTVAAQVKQRDYAARSYLSGQHSDARLTWHRQLAPRLSMELTFGPDAADLNTAHNSFTGWTLGGALSLANFGAIDLAIGGKLANRAYRGLYPALGVARKDKAREVFMRVAHREINVFGTRPTVTCTLSDQRSNVAFYDVDSFDCALAFQTSF